MKSSRVGNLGEVLVKHLSTNLCIRLKPNDYKDIVFKVHHRRLKVTYLYSRIDVLIGKITADKWGTTVDEIEKTLREMGAREDKRPTPRSKPCYSLYD